MTLLVEPHLSDAQDDELLALWSRNLPEIGSTRQRWLYHSGRARSWFLQNSDGCVIGSAGMMHRLMQCGGREFMTGQAIDLNVDVAFRSVGPALALQRQLAAQLGDNARGFLYGVPSPQAEGVLKRVGYKRVGDLERWVKPIHTYRKLKEYTSSRSLACASAPFVNLGLKFISRETWLNVPKRYAVEHLDEFDQRFDRLWAETRDRYPIIGERSANYLQWRFAEHPDREFEILALVSVDHRKVCGYVVSHMDDGGLIVADLLFRDAESLDAMMIAFLKRARTLAVESVTMIYLGNRELTESLRSFGFYKRPSRRQLLVLPEKTELNVDLFNSQNWYLTKADSDIDI